MTPEAKHQLYNLAMHVNGFDTQEHKVYEECAELVTALARYKYDRSSVSEIITELSDVSIMVEQMAQHFGQEAFDREKEYKLNRLNQRLHEGL